MERTQSQRVTTQATSKPIKLHLVLSVIVTLIGIAALAEKGLDMGRWPLICLIGGPIWFIGAKALDWWDHG